jgi:hypothetical protein
MCFDRSDGRFNAEVEVKDEVESTSRKCTNVFDQPQQPSNPNAYLLSSLGRDTCHTE